MSGSIRVSTRAELSDALETAQGGETIILADGDYEKLKVTQEFDTAVTIRAAGNDARVSALEVEGAAGVTLDGLIFDYVHDARNSTGHRDFTIMESQDIVIRNALFNGDDLSEGSTEDVGYPAGKALSIGRSANITVESSEVKGFWKGINFGNSTGITLRDNEIHDMRSDGINIVDSTAVLIEGNHIHDFRGNPDSDDHADFIQMYPTGDGPVPSDIVIRDNLLDIGDGIIAQSIFLTQAGQVVDRLGYVPVFENIEVTGNVIVGGHTHGIKVGQADGLVVANNTLVTPPEAGMPAPRIWVDPLSTDVAITGNMAERIEGTDDASSWSVGNNMILQHDDPYDQSHYDQVFLNSSDVTNAPEDLTLLPGSAADLANVGAPMLRHDPAPETLTALARGDSGSFIDEVTFDAGYSAGPDGDVASQGAHFHWDFGDGTTGEGVTATHDYDAPGRYTATLTVTMPDGRTDTTKIVTSIKGPDALHYDAGAGTFFASAYGETSAFQHRTNDAASIDPDTGHIDIGWGGRIDIPRSATPAIYDAESMAIRLDMKADGAGEFLRQHTSFKAWIDGDGGVSISLTTAEGSKLKVHAAEAGMLDGNWHDVALVFDGSGPGLSIAVDGVVMDTQEATGMLKPAMSWDMRLGGGFAGEIREMDVDADSHLYNLGSAPTTGDQMVEDDPAPGGETGAEPVSLAGSSGDDMLAGTSGDDGFTLRWGSDTATGGAGADTFVFDGRYVTDGDAHTVTDLDFAEGDALFLRFFEKRKEWIDSEADLAALDARDFASVTDIGGSRLLTLTDNGGDVVEITVSFAETAATPIAAEPPAQEDPMAEPVSLAGSSGDDMLAGTSGDDDFTLRWGSDTATGGAGADTFVFDGRYVTDGDAHTVTDLDFAEGDALFLRFFEKRKEWIDSEADLAALDARDFASVTDIGGSRLLTLTDNGGDVVEITVDYADIA